MIADNAGPFRIEVDEGGYTNINIWLGKTLLVAVDDFYAQGESKGVDDHHDATIYVHIGKDDPKELIHYNKPDYSPQAMASKLADEWASEGVDRQAIMWLMERVHKVGMDAAAKEYFTQN